GAMLAGVMRLPFTSIMFALELTHNASALPVLLVSCTTAYGVSVFLMKRSILTEKIARRGLDIFREYTVDRLEHIPVREVMTTEMVTVPGELSVRELADRYFGADQQYRAFPVLDADGGLPGPSHAARHGHPLRPAQAVHALPRRGKSARAVLP